MREAPVPSGPMTGEHLLPEELSCKAKDIGREHRLALDTLVGSKEGHVCSSGGRGGGWVGRAEGVLGS